MQKGAERQLDRSLGRTNMRDRNGWKEGRKEGSKKQEVITIHTMKANRGRGGTAPLILNLDTR